MKRSRTVDLVLLLSAAAGLEGCGRQQCVDERGVVVDDRLCQTSSPVATGMHGYRFYNGGMFGYVPQGGNINSGTERGVFGGAGESASHGGGGEGGGE